MPQATQRTVSPVAGKTTDLHESKNFVAHWSPTATDTSATTIEFGKFTAGTSISTFLKVDYTS